MVVAALLFTLQFCSARQARIVFVGNHESESHEKHADSGGDDGSSLHSDARGRWWYIVVSCDLGREKLPVLVIKKVGESIFEIM